MCDDLYYFLLLMTTHCRGDYEDPGSAPDHTSKEK